MMIYCENISTGHTIKRSYRRNLVTPLKRDTLVPKFCPYYFLKGHFPSLAVPQVPAVSCLRTLYQVCVHSSFRLLVTFRARYLLIDRYEHGEDFLNREPARVQAVEELQRTQVQLEQIKRSSINLPVHEKAGILYQEAEQQQSVPYQTPYLSFSCPTFSILQAQIEQLGEVVQLKAPEYYQKQPILTPVMEGKNDGLNGLSLDELNEKVYITDTSNHCVQVMSFQGEILSRFGEDVLSCPWGISATHGDIFVTDYGNHALSRFCKNSHQLLYRTDLKGSDEGQLFGPRGLSVDWNGDLFVADRLNHRISVFTNHLQYKHTMGHGSLSFPKDVELTMDKVVVLDNSPNCIHFFSRRSRELIASCVPKGLVYQPWFFCMDCVQNILVSDHLHHVIKIFSSSEKLLHTIGKKGNEEGKGKGEFKEPVGIALSNSGKLFVLSRNTNYSLQLF